MTYLKKILLVITSICLSGLVACSEDRAPTKQELIVAQAWLACTQQEKWKKAYEQVGTLGTRLAIREECGAEPPFVPDD